MCQLNQLCLLMQDCGAQSVYASIQEVLKQEIQLYNSHSGSCTDSQTLDVHSCSEHMFCVLHCKTFSLPEVIKSSKEVKEMHAALQQSFSLRLLGRMCILIAQRIQ